MAVGAKPGWQLGEEAGLEEVTEFLVVAATLLDLKTARLVPSGEVQDPEDLALLQAEMDAWPGPDPPPWRAARSGGRLIRARGPEPAS